MKFPSAVRRHSIALVLALAAGTAGAADVALAGLLPGKAVLVVNGGNPRTLSIGARTPEGVRLIAIENGIAATVEIDGKKQRLVLGEHAVSSGGSGGGAAAVTLTGDGRGQFFAVGSVNGASMRFMVDTGASYVSLNANDAARAGIDYRKKGEPGVSSTANGLIRTWRVPGNTVQLGDVTLHQVEVSVSETSMPITLLGMSFLNRLEMKRDGDTMTLKKRY